MQQPTLLRLYRCPREDSLTTICASRGDTMITASLVLYSHLKVVIMWRHALVGVASFESTHLSPTMLLNHCKAPPNHCTFRSDTVNSIIISCCGFLPHGNVNRALAYMMSRIRLLYGEKNASLIEEGVSETLGATPSLSRQWSNIQYTCCLLYTSPSPRDLSTSRMPSSA